MEELYKKDHIRTFTGKYVNVFNPTPEMICIEDIAHSLSNQCRFAGHLKQFYSVADHSINCAMQVAEEHKLAALLHDASEAYLIDIPSPIKKRLTNYHEIEDNLMRLIANKFGFTYPFDPVIKEIDEYMLRTEWDCLMLGNEGPKFLKPLINTDAEFVFIRLYKELTAPNQLTNIF